jgi:hypothetical protein
MSEWRGILHPRDRRGQFRQSLERLAAMQPAQSRVSFQGGAIARDRRGYFRSEAQGHPTARHRSARAAVDRLIAVGKASPAASVAEFEALRRRYERAPVIASADPVAKAAQALANLYRAQESGQGQGRAKASVTESWRGLDLRQRSRAKLLARHLVSA